MDTLDNILDTIQCSCDNSNLLLVQRLLSEIFKLMSDVNVSLQQMMHFLTLKIVFGYQSFASSRCIQIRAAIDKQTSDERRPDPITNCKLTRDIPT